MSRRLAGCLLVAAALAGCRDADGPAGEPAEAPSSAPAPAKAAAPAPEKTPPEPAAEAGPAPPSQAHPGATRYPPRRIFSPLTAAVSKRLRAIAERDPSLSEDVFLKVGASGSASPLLMSCFAGDHVVLGDFGHLAPAIEAFRRGRIGDTTPFDRSSAAAEPGKTAGWAIEGDPSPLETELAAAHGRFALVHYGTNDMHMAGTFASALGPFARNETTLVDGLLARGVIPILGALSPRLDDVEASRWITTYNTWVRALAQSRQIPLLDLHTAALSLPGRGRSADALHANVYRDGGVARACVFTDEGLAYAYNVRNLMTMRLLARVRAIALGLGDEPDPDEPALKGDGSPEAPFRVEELPFADLRDISRSRHISKDDWPGCASGRPTIGPELEYRLVVERVLPVRIVAVNVSPRTNVDLVLLSEDRQRCVGKAAQVLETTLMPGTYRIVVDTVVEDDVPRWGEFALLVVPCDDGDPACVPRSGDGPLIQ